VILYAYAYNRYQQVMMLVVVVENTQYLKLVVLGFCRLCAVSRLAAPAHRQTLSSIMGNPVSSASGRSIQTGKDVPQLGPPMPVAMTS